MNFALEIAYIGKLCAIFVQNLGDIICTTVPTPNFGDSYLCPHDRSTPMLDPPSKIINTQQ